MVFIIYIKKNVMNWNCNKDVNKWLLNRMDIWVNEKED